MNGWICPKCGKVYAPFIHACLECNEKAMKAEQEAEAINHALCHRVHNTLSPLFSERYGYKKPTDATMAVVCDYCGNACGTGYHTTEIRTDGNHRRMCVDCWNTRDRGNETQQAVCDFPTLLCHRCKKPFLSDSLKFTNEGLLCAYCYYPKIEVTENER